MPRSLLTGTVRRKRNGPTGGFAYGMSVNSNMVRGAPVRSVKRSFWPIIEPHSVSAIRVSTHSYVTSKYFVVVGQESPRINGFDCKRHDCLPLQRALILLDASKTEHCILLIS